MSPLTHVSAKTKPKLKLKLLAIVLLDNEKGCPGSSSLSILARAPIAGVKKLIGKFAGMRLPSKVEVTSDR